ncbi:hypothetical protein Tdes44962_MAKER03380 [Teratosphaeria destructans]|uniref:Uncharacterized protein n=1 Tax=Teratosphaeria destructans TaxID=418781 RepID=A0A9W7SQH3_9PEZI|nr:hypothetical protein Tdes44962_MAKER03380 [Teratosphaeria destructans]
MPQPPPSQAPPPPTPPHPPQQTSPLPPTEYIPQPPPLPFSSEDSTDAIALRAAISALQFQKKKAQQDIRLLQDMKTQALDDPQHFRNEVAAKRFHEARPQFGGVQAIIDQSSESDSDESDAKPGASNEDAMDLNGTAKSDDARPAEVPDSQPSHPTPSDHKTTSGSREAAPRSRRTRADFSHIPGAQNIVRMPAVNWEKYHITGEPLEKMHEHQQRWPGSSFAYGDDQREFAVAASFSPFQDHLDGRKDSFAAHSASVTPTGTISEHPMETRRGGARNSHH